MACLGEYGSQEFILPPFDELDDREQQLNAARQFIIVNLLQKVCAFYDSTPRQFLAQALEYIKLGILNAEWQSFLQNPDWQSHAAESSTNGAGNSVSKLLSSLVAKATLPRSSPYIGFHRHSPPCGRFACRPTPVYCGQGRDSSSPTRSPDVSRRFNRHRRKMAIPKAKSSLAAWSNERDHRKETYDLDLAPPVAMETHIVPRCTSEIIQVYPQAIDPNRPDSPRIPRSPRMLDSIGARLGLGAPMTANLSIFERDFLFIRALGRGAFGVVYEVQNKLDLRKYAMKVVLFHTHDRDLKNKALREVQSWSKARHPHVCRYSHAWIEPGWALQTFSQTGTSIKNPENTISTIKTSPRFRKDSEPSMDNSFAINEDSLVQFEESGAGTKRDDDVVRSLPLEHDTSLPLGHGRSEPPGRALSFPQSLFIQMELCQDTLEQWCRSGSKLVSPNDMTHQQLAHHVTAVLTIFGQIVSALQHIHAINIVHRDIKPSNIYRAVDDCWVLGDFGLSKSIHETMDEVPPWSFEVESGTVGTAAYSAPEQLVSGKVTTSADIFAMGLVLLECLLLFPTKHERALAFLLLRDERRLPDTSAMRCFPNIGALILAITSPDPEDRPSASSLLNVHSSWRRTITHELQSFCQRAKVEAQDVWQLPMQSPSLLTSPSPLRDAEFPPLEPMDRLPTHFADCGVQTDF